MQVVRKMNSGQAGEQGGDLKWSEPGEVVEIHIYIFGYINVLTSIAI